MTDALTPLSTDESSMLTRCEGIISRGLDTFVDCGNALLKIRDDKLYRADFPDFQAYCRERWQIGRSHAYRLIEAAEVAQNVPEVETERQARELTGATKDLQNEVWKIAEETAPVINGKPSVTASHIKAVREVLTAVIEGGGLDDGTGEPKPLGTLLRANVIEHVYERMQRQEEAIREKQERKARNAEHARDVPTLPAARGLMNLVTSLIKGIERMNLDRGTKMHPALADPYHFGKAIIGELTAETRLLIDNIAIEADCEGCPANGVSVYDVALTVNLNGSGVRSWRLKLCVDCQQRYCGAMSIISDAEVVER